jgi:hypothetical protein
MGSVSGSGHHHRAIHRLRHFGIRHRRPNCRGAHWILRPRHGAHCSLVGARCRLGEVRCKSGAGSPRAAAYSTVVAIAKLPRVHTAVAIADILHGCIAAAIVGANHRVRIVVATEKILHVRTVVVIAKRRRVPSAAIAPDAMAECNVANYSDLPARSVRVVRARATKTSLGWSFPACQPSFQLCCYSRRGYFARGPVSNDSCFPIAAG